MKAEPDRATVFCLTCETMTAVDILTGQGDAGTERRFRAGETTIADLEAQCRARQADCRLEAVEAGAAVGWLSSYGSGGGYGATAVLLRDGDMLTIRSLAGDADLATRNAKAAIRDVAPQVVGR